jgi:hypothetical protein
MRELGKNNAAVMGNAWFSEVHQVLPFSLCFVAETAATEDAGWTRISLLGDAHACSICSAAYDMGAKAVLFFLCCLAWILM